MLFNYGQQTTAIATKSAVATSTSLSVGTTSQQIFAPDPTRCEWLILNPSSNAGLLYAGFGSGAISTTTAVVAIAPGQIWRQFGDSAKAELRGLSLSAAAQNYGVSQIILI